MKCESNFQIFVFLFTSFCIRQRNETCDNHHPSMLVNAMSLYSKMDRWIWNFPASSVSSLSFEYLKCLILRQRQCYDEIDVLVEANGCGNWHWLTYYNQWRTLESENHRTNFRLYIFVRQRLLLPFPSHRIQVCNAKCIHESELYRHRVVSVLMLTNRWW